MNSHFVRVVILSVCGLMGAHGQQWNQDEVRAALEAIDQAADESSVVREVSSSPLYHQVATVRFLLREACPDKANRLGGDAVLAQELRARRAAKWLMELTGERLVVRKDGVLNNCEEANDVIRAWVRGRVAAVKAEGAAVEDLKQIYRGSIRETQQMAGRSALAMFELLKKWQPVGKRFSDLQTILDEANKEGDGMFSYTFDTGYGGYRFVFDVKDGIIENVIVTGLE